MIPFICKCLAQQWFRLTISNIFKENVAPMDKISKKLLSKRKKQTMHEELFKKESFMIVELAKASVIRDRKARKTAVFEEKLI
jgi:hypothetical protein